MEHARDFLDALDRFIRAVREIRFEERHERVDDRRERIGIFCLFAFEEANGAIRLGPCRRNLLELDVERIDFGLQGLVLRRKVLHLLATDFDEFGMALLFGFVHRFFAGGFSLHRLDLATDTFHRFLGNGKNARYPQT